MWIRESAQQLENRLRATVKNQVEVIVGQEPHGEWPVPRRLGESDRLHDVAVLREPLSDGTVQRRDRRRGDAPKLELEQVGEEVVVAEPRTSRVQRRHEPVRILEVQLP